MNFISGFLGPIFFIMAGVANLGSTLGVSITLGVGFLSLALFGAIYGVGERIATAIEEKGKE